jgi:polysaccharide chain length determinant protein (PEP-CTERM system associated)
MAFYRPTNLRDYKELTRRLLRRKWLILGVFSMVLAVSGGLVLRMPKMYKSTAMILIQPGQMNNAVVVNLNLEARLRTLRQTITSRTELESIVLELNLFPELRETRSMDDVVEFTRRRVEVVVQGRDLFQVSFVHENPNVAQVVAERLSRKLIDESASDDVKSSRDKVDFLTQRTEQLKRDLKEWDAKIQQFNEDNAEILVLEQGAGGPIAAAREQLKAIEQELKRAEKSPSGYRRPRDSGSGPSAGTADPEVSRLRSEVEVAQGRLDALRLNNTDGHPDVVAARKQLQAVQGQLARAQSRVPAPTTSAPRPEPAPVATPAAPTGQSEVARLREERDAVLASIDRVNANMRELPRVRAQLGEIERERRRVTEALDVEVRKLAEAETNFNVVAANKGDTFKVQDPANLPQQPDSPRKAIVLAAAGVLGLLIALGVALLLVYLDQTVYNEYELSRVTELPVLVSIGEYDMTALPEPGVGPDPRAPGGSGARTHGG